MVIKVKPANSENKMVNLALIESWHGPVDESIWRLARGCSLKAVYATKRAAKRAAIAYKRVTGQRCGIYRCELCGDWHLTTLRYKLRSVHPVGMCA